MARELKELKEFRVFSIQAVLTVVLNSHPKVENKWIFLCKPEEFVVLCDFFLDAGSLYDLGVDELRPLFCEVKRKIFFQAPVLKRQLTEEVIGRYIDSLNAGDNRKTEGLVVSLKPILKTYNNIFGHFFVDQDCDGVVLERVGKRWWDFKKEILEAANFVQACLEKNKGAISLEKSF